MSTRDPILSGHIRRFMELAPDQYRRCYSTDFRFLLCAATPHSSREIAKAMQCSVSAVSKRIRQLMAWGLIEAIGQTESRTKTAVIYQSINPHTFAEKRRNQINAANPFGFSAREIAERNRYLNEESST